MIATWVNTDFMSKFPAQVSAKHRCDFIVMVVDGARSQVASEFIVPKNIRPLRLPPYGVYPRQKPISSQAASLPPLSVR